MAVGSKIKGITIEFDGNTTKLGASLKKIQAETKKVDQALRQVDRSLRFNPGNTELLAQKQVLLRDKIKATEASLQQLRAAQAKLDADPSVDKTSADYMELRREIIKTENQLKRLQKEQRLVAAQMTRMGQASAGLKKLGTRLTTLGNQMRGLSIAAALVTAAMAGLAIKSSQYADQINTLAKQTGIGTRELQIYRGAAELVDVSVEDMAKGHAKLTKSMAAARKGTGDAADAFAQLGINVTDSNGELRNNQEVFAETIAALGEMDNATERDALAFAIFGKSAQKLNPLILGGSEALQHFTKRAEELGVILDQETLDAANAFKDTIDESKSLISMAGMKLGAALGQALLPMVEAVTNGLVRLSVWLSNLSPAGLRAVTVIGAIVAAIGPLLIAFGSMATGLSNILRLFSLLNAGAAAGGAAKAFSGLFAVIRSHPILLLVGALAALVGWIAKSGVSSEELQAKIEGFGQKIAEVIPKIVEALPTAITALVDAFTTAITAVIGALPTLLPAVVNAGIALFMGLVDALPSVIEALVSALPQIIDAIAAAIPVLIPALIEAGILLFTALVDAIPKIAKAIGKALPQIVKAVKSGLERTLPKVWDKIKDTAVGRFILMVKQIGDKIKAVKDKIVKPFQDAKEKVDKVVEGIKKFFPLKIGKLFTGMKLPHFKVSGSPPFGIGGKGEKPGISVSWYKKALNQPYLFDSPTFFGAGERGDEMLYGRKRLLQDIAAAVGSGGGGGATFNITVNGAPDPALFADQLVRQLKMRTRTV